MTNRPRKLIAFKKLSADAIQIAHGRDGFYVATCPMAAVLGCK